MVYGSSGSVRIRQYHPNSPFQRHGADQTALTPATGRNSGGYPSVGSSSCVYGSALRSRALSPSNGQVIRGQPTAIAGADDGRESEKEKGQKGPSPPSPRP